MIVAEAIQRIQSIYSRGVQSQDSRLMPKHIWNKLLTVRESLVIQKANKNQPISQWVYQTVPCVELVKAAPYECPCVPPSGCILLRSKFPFPIPVTALKGDLIQSVSSLDGNFIIDGTDFATNKYNEGNKYTSKKPQRFLYNNYLYITVVTQLKVVQVTMIAQNPEEVWNYPSFCEEECTECCISPLDRRFPLDNDTTDVAIQLASNELISVFTQMRADIFNNTQDDTVNSNLVHNPQQQQ